MDISSKFIVITDHLVCDVLLNSISGIPNLFSELPWLKAEILDQTFFVQTSGLLLNSYLTFNNLLNFFASQLSYL